MAILMPMSRTRTAPTREGAGLPIVIAEELNQQAPATLKRHGHLGTHVRIELHLLAGQGLQPTTHVPAGSRNNGSSISEATVICQDSANIVISTTIRLIRFPSTPDSAR